MAIGPVDIEFVLKGDVDKQLKKASDTIRGESAALKNQLADFGKTFTETYDKSATSIAGMRQKLEALKKVFAELSEEGRKSDLGKNISSQINQLGNSIERAERQNKSFLDTMKELPGPIGATVTGMEGMVKAALRFIATPIGAVIAAIVVALKMLTAWFKSSEEGENALSETTEYFKGVLDSLLDPIEAVGEWLYKAFTMPKMALEDLVKFIQDQLLNRLKGITKMGEAITKIFAGDLKAGFFDFVNAGLQFSSGFEDPLKRGATYFKDMAYKAKSRKEIQAEINELAKEERDYLNESAGIRAKIKNLTFSASDTDKPAAEGVKKLEQAMELQNKISSKGIELANRRLELTRQMKSLDDQTIADKIELNNLDIQAKDLASERDMLLKSMTRQLNGLKNRAAEESVKGVKALTAELEKLQLEILDADGEQLRNIAIRITELQKELKVRAQIADEAIKLVSGYREMPEIDAKKVFNGLAEKAKKEANPAGLELEKLQKKIDQNQKNVDKWQGKAFDNEKIKKFAKTSQDILDVATSLTIQYAEQLGLSEDQAAALSEASNFASGILDLASGNYAQGAFKIIGSLISAIATVPEAMNVHFEKVKENIEKVVNSISIAQESLSYFGGNQTILSLTTLERELKNLRFEAVKLNEQTSSISFGKLFDLDFANLLQAYTSQVELIKKEINDLTAKLIGGNLNEAQRKSIEALLESYNILMGKIDDVTQQITGVTVQSLSESLSQAFYDGIDAAEQWGDTVNSIIKKIVLDQLATKFIAGPIQTAIDQLMKNTEGGLDPWEALQFKTTIEQLAASVGPAFDEARKALESIGISLGTGGSASDTSQLTGAVTNITEETAGLISGQLTGIKVDVRQLVLAIGSQIDAMDRGLVYQAEIAANTRHNVKLNSIDARLEEMIRVLKQM